MRLTTKIVLGIIISLFLLSFGAIIIISFIDEKFKENSNLYTPDISQKNIIPVNVEPFQTVWIDQVQIQDALNVFLRGTIRLKPVINPDEKNKLFLPEELLRFTDIISSNDTLIIRLKVDELYEQYVTSRVPKHLFCVIEGFNFFIHTNTVDVISDMVGMQVDVRNIKTDKIKIQANSAIAIDSCQTNLIAPRMRNSPYQFLLTNSQVKELNIDLDQMGDTWTIKNCDIEVENLTGSNKHSVSLPKGEANIMHWMPKNKDAQLTVTLYGDTASVEFP